jgi:hypothetical protein
VPEGVQPTIFGSNQRHPFFDHRAAVLVENRLHHATSHLGRQMVDAYWRSEDAVDDALLRRIASIL